MSRETEKRQLRAGNFTMNNGRVLSTINLLREKYNAPDGIRLIRPDAGSWRT